MGCQQCPLSSHKNQKHPLGGSPPSCRGWWNLTCCKRSACLQKQFRLRNLNNWKYADLHHQYTIPCILHQGRTWQLTECLCPRLQKNVQRMLVFNQDEETQKSGLSIATGGRVKHMGHLEDNSVGPIRTSNIKVFRPICFLAKYLSKETGIPTRLGPIHRRALFVKRKKLASSRSPSREDGYNH